MDIIETEKFGVANTINGKIYLHPKLRDFPKLREKIISHESEHINSKGFLANRKVDALTELKFKDLYPFYKKYPKTFFQQHFPITYKDGNLYLEWTLIFLYSFYIGLGFLIYYLIRIFSTDWGFFWKVVQNMTLIFIVVLSLYVLGKKLKEYINKEAQKDAPKK